MRKVALLSQPDAGGEMEEEVPRVSAREKQGLVSVWGQLFNYCYRLNYYDSLEFIWWCLNP